MKFTSKWLLGVMAATLIPLYAARSEDVAPLPAAPAAPPPAPAVATSPATLTVKPSRDVHEVVKLSKAGLSEEVIMAYVKNARPNFNLRADDILYLKEQGISTTVITAMLTHDKMSHDGLNVPPPGVMGSQPMPPPGAPGPNVPVMPPEAPDATANIVRTPPLVPGGPMVSPDGSQPPPLQTEVVPVSPGADYYWAPGYWGWNGGWVWFGGGWYPHGYYGWGWGRGGWRGGWGGGWHGGGHVGGGGGFGRSSGGGGRGY